MEWKCAHCKNDDLDYDFAEEIDLKSGVGRFVYTCGGCGELTCITMKVIEFEAY